MSDILLYLLYACVICFQVEILSRVTQLSDDFLLERLYLLLQDLSILDNSRALSITLLVERLHELHVLPKHIGYTRHLHLISALRKRDR